MSHGTSSMSSSMAAMTSDTEDDFVVVESNSEIEKLQKEHKQTMKALVDTHLAELAMLRDSCNRRAENAIRTAGLSIDRNNERHQDEVRDLRKALAAEQAKVAHLMAACPPHLRGRAAGSSQ